MSTPLNSQQFHIRTIDVYLANREMVREARKACSQFLKEFAECSSDKLFAWKCRPILRNLEECLANLYGRFPFNPIGSHSNEEKKLEIVEQKIYDREQKRRGSCASVS